MTNVVPFPKARIVRIPPAQQEDVRVTFARAIERRLAEMEAERWDAIMEGKLPARFAEDSRPSDTDGDAA